MNTYKLGIRAVYQKDIPTAIKEAKHNGFEVLEIHLSSPQFLPQNYSAADCKRVKAFSQEQGIVLQTHSEIGQSLLQTDAILRKAEQQKLKQLVDFSKKIGARSLTIHPGNVAGYFAGPGKRIANDTVYPKYYAKLFEESIKHIVKIAPRDLYICIENADSFIPEYQSTLDRYMKTNKVFLTCDFIKLRKGQQQFFQKNRKYVKNIHISGPGHGAVEGMEKDLAEFLERMVGADAPIIFEILSLKEAIKTKKLIQSF